MTIINIFKDKGPLVCQIELFQSFPFGYAKQASSLKKATLHSCWRGALPKPICLFRCLIFESNSKQHPESLHKTFSFAMTQETQAQLISSEHLLKAGNWAKMLITLQ